MRLSSEQLERLSERIFSVLKASGYVDFLYDEEPDLDERVVLEILKVLEDDSRMEDRLSREAERLVQQQGSIARSSTKSVEQLVEEVKLRLAKSKKVIIDDGPERADTVAELIFKKLWTIDALDFFEADRKVINSIAHAVYRFRNEDDRILDAVETLVNKKLPDATPYSKEWCIAFERYHSQVLKKIESKRAESSTEEASE